MTISNSPRFSAPSIRFQLTRGEPDFLGTREEDKPGQTFAVHASIDGIETQIREALAAIDATQQWPDDVAQIPLYQVVRTPGAFGGFYHEGGQAQGIVINQLGPHPRLTTCHEVGHFFDFDLVGPRGTFESERAENPDSPLHNWWQAIHRSARFATLFDTLNDPIFRADAGEFLKRRELFARSYAQYVARKSGHAGMSEELREIQAAYGMESLRQWDAADFAAIKTAFDKLLKQLEMMP